MTRVILASASPRRRELLSALVSRFEVMPADVPEPLSSDGRSDALRLAAAKASALAAAHPGAVVIGSDTVVHDSAAVYGKPVDEADAAAMLLALRGRQHTVTTGVAVAWDGGIETEASDAVVELASLTDDEVRAYVASGRPLDKAGAYAIQDEDVPTVVRFDGCYCCVMGLPLWRVSRLLARAGVASADPGATFERCRACPEKIVEQSAIR